MEKLNYDPADGTAFWEAVERLPGYPLGERMPIPVMLFESDAIYRTSEVLMEIGADPLQPLVVVMDRTPMRRGGRSLKAMFLQMLNQAGWTAYALYLEGDTLGQVHTDMAQIDTVRRRLQPGMAVIALGSGTVCDITKHACFLFQQETSARLPFLVYQTANSVSAFTSNMAPTFFEGVKRTLPSRYPDALICDLETLQDAPYEMTVAGVGDLLAAFVSLGDWYLANQLGMDDSYTELAGLLMGPLYEIFKAAAQPIRERSLEGMAVLAKLIALGGLAMSLSHATAPMSGYEHSMSHTLDLLAEMSQRPLCQHGSQVAVATILAAGAYQHLLDELEPQEVAQEGCFPSAEEMEQRIRQIFLQVDPSGKAGEECWKDYAPKLQTWQTRRAEFGRFLEDWPAQRQNLSQLVQSPERVVEILRLIDAPLTFAALQPPISQAEASFAFLNSALLRKRMTSGDLLVFLNWDRQKLLDQLWSAEPFRLGQDMG